MNLWVKRTGQLFIAVLFLMSCEDDTFLLGFRNQNKKFNVRYQEFTLPSTVVQLDSSITDNLGFGDLYRLLVGEYVDPRFGTVQAIPFTQVQPSSFTQLDTLAEYDSITFQIRIDYYAYGPEVAPDEKFTIHEITEDSLSARTRYYNYTSFGYDAAPLAEVSLKLASFTEFTRSAQDNDTLLFEGRLDDTFGQKVFNNMIWTAEKTFKDMKKFKYNVKGLAFVPSQNNMILGLDINTNLTKLTLHYHTPTKDSITRTLNMAPGNVQSFTNITTNRTGDLAGMTQSYEGFAPASGNRYLQNGTPVVTKIDITKFYDFITGSADGINDSLTQIIINSAELSMDVEAAPDGMPPPSILILKAMNSDDVFFNNVLDADSTELAGFYLHTGINPFTRKNFGKHYYPGGDNLEA
jgi:hypothetical protein